MFGYVFRVGLVMALACIAGVPVAEAAFSVVYSFKGGNDGAQPFAPVIDVGGTLYGTTRAGGAHGKGTVFSVTPSGVERVLHSFKGGSDGDFPWAGLINVGFYGNRLYGTTYYGGAYNQGTVFSVTPSGAERVLYSFKGGSDGAQPMSNSGLINVGGTLYGTTVHGGGFTGCQDSYGTQCGTVFSVTLAGVEKVLHRFTGGQDGGMPLDGLLNLGGTLYGTTWKGGGSTVCSDGYGPGCGTVFSVTPAGVQKVLYRFQGGRNGGEPYAGVINVGGLLYGTTTKGAGTVFRMTLTGAKTTLHTFGGSGDGHGPIGRLLDVGGTLYGTTIRGGTDGAGTVYKLTPDGVETVIHSFTGGSDGGFPWASLISVNGTLYGTAADGGAYGSGTVFKVTP